MAISTFSVTYTDVLPDLPINSASISASSTPISTGDITSYIEDAGSQLAGVMQIAGLDPSALDDDATQQAEAAIKSYAVGKCLQHLGYSGAKLDGAFSRWREQYDRYKANPRLLSGKGSRVRSNVDQSSTREPFTFATSYYKF